MGGASGHHTDHGMEYSFYVLYGSFYLQSSSYLVPIVYCTVSIIKIPLSLHLLYCVLVLELETSIYTLLQFSSYTAEISKIYFHIIIWKFKMRITETFSLCYSEAGVGVDDF